MFTDPLYMTGCLGKTKFVCRKDAQMALKQIQKCGRLQHVGSDKGQRGKIEAYFCGFCGHYHHGHAVHIKRRTKRSRRVEIGE